MSKKADQLLQDQLANRWSTTSNPAAASSAIATSRAAGVLGRMNVDTLTYSIANQTAAAINNTLSIRSSAQSGTVLAQLRIQVPTGQGVQFNGAINIPGKIGQAVAVDISGAASSVLHNVTICGWEDGQR